MKQVPYVIAAIISATWVIVALVGLFRSDYTGITIVTPLMLTVAGFVFAIKRNGGS